MRTPNGELIDRLAAEFVLGTLRGRARRRFQRWLDGPDAAARDLAQAAVRRWEDRLTTLTKVLQPVDPSPRVWRDIERRLGRQSPAAGWWPLAVAASLAVVAVALWWNKRSPDLPVWQTAAELRTSPQDAAAWVVEVDASRKLLRVRTQTGLAIAANQSHELWALGDGAGPPVSLGLLPRQGEAEKTLTDAQQLALAGARKLAVSLEPLGGSPTGAPTGPVLLAVDLRLS